jgi:hypothetical protein
MDYHEATREKPLFLTIGITRKAYDLTWKHEGAYVEHGCMDIMRFTQKKEFLKVMGPNRTKHLGY